MLTSVSPMHYRRLPVLAFNLWYCKEIGLFDLLLFTYNYCTIFGISAKMNRIAYSIFLF